MRGTANEDGGEPYTMKWKLRDRGLTTKKHSVLVSSGDSGSSDTKKSLEYINYCGTNKDPSTDAADEAAAAGANSTNDDKQTASFVDIRLRYLLSTMGTTYAGNPG